MGEPSLARRVLSGEAGWWAWPIRTALAGGEFFYSLAIQTRNARYDSGKGVVSVSAPVISVGNITVGGTGKTPVVIDLIRRLESLQCNPAVLARGYGSEYDEPNDEELLVRKYCPGVAYVAAADRAHGAHQAVSRMGADVVVLDDGFQHRRLHRDLDIVLIDALCPFGYGHVLPRGLLREPLKDLSRAGVLVITRSDQVSANEVSRIEHVIQKHNQSAPILRSRTNVMRIERLDGAQMDSAGGKKVLAFAAIGQPQAFVGTLKSLGFDVVATRWWPDHYAYRGREIVSLLENKSFPPHDLVLTTEKDAMKLARLRNVDVRSIGVVKIGIELLDGGNDVLDGMLRQVLRACKAVAT